VDLTEDLEQFPVTIQIGSLDHYGSGVIGLCETGYGLRRVTLDPDFWNNVSNTQKELLMHHELGHCILYRAHRTSLLSSGAEASIMYPIIMASSTYLNDYNYYQNELFTWGAATLPVDGSTQHICDQSEL